MFVANHLDAESPSLGSRQCKEITEHLEHLLKYPVAHDGDPRYVVLLGAWVGSSGVLWTCMHHREVNLN